MQLTGTNSPRAWPTIMQAMKPSIQKISLFGFQGAKKLNSSRKPAKRLWFEEETQRNEWVFTKVETNDMKFVSTKLVFIRLRVHPFPSRTRKLSSVLPTILGWRRPGKIGNANTARQSEDCRAFLFQCSKMLVRIYALHRYEVIHWMYLFVRNNIKLHVTIWVFGYKLVRLLLQMVF